MAQMSFVELARSNKQLKVDLFLQEMTNIIPWDRLLNKLKPHYYNNKIGRPAYDPLLMMKIHCLQQWYALSDKQAEEAIYDRFSFQKFLNLDPLQHSIPDETTILNFRHFLEENHLGEKIFMEINIYLGERGLLLRTGTITDATFVSASSSTKNKEQKRDPEMSSAKKNNEWHFGMKMHIGTDAKNGAAHSVIVTSAKVSDRDMFYELLHGEESAIFADKGYYSDQDKQLARSVGIYFGVMEKRKHGYGELSHRQEIRNHRHSSIRSKVEHVFRIIKDLWKFRKTRFKGLAKNENKLQIMLGLANLYLLRRRLILQTS
jgi:IS5 family transposase